MYSNLILPYMSNSLDSYQLIGFSLENQILVIVSLLFTLVVSKFY